MSILDTTRAMPRGRFLKVATAAGAGAALAGVVHQAGASSLAAQADAPLASTCHESVQQIIDAALIAEQLATTFYYTGLTTRSIAAMPQVAGRSGDPNHVSADGNPGNVAYLQAALDQEQKHAQLLANAGAKSSYTHFYFPASTFERIGFTSHQGTYLSVLDHLETAFISAYLAAINRFAVLGHADLAQLAGRLLGVECEHRALYRVIAGDDPANNITLAVTSFSCVSQVAEVLKPYLTGHGFANGATPAIPLPTPAQTARIIGKNTSS